MSYRNSVLKSMALTGPALEFKLRVRLFPKCSSRWVAWRRTCHQIRFKLIPLTFLVSTEVVEHLYRPRRMIQNAFRLLKPSGYFITSTPYHGYVKNVLLALSGKMDNHFTALWDGGHIKFRSRETLSRCSWKEDLHMFGSWVRDLALYLEEYDPDCPETVGR